MLFYRSSCRKIEKIIALSPSAVIQFIRRTTASHNVTNNLRSHKLYFLLGMTLFCSTSTITSLKEFLSVQAACDFVEDYFKYENKAYHV